EKALLKTEIHPLEREVPVEKGQTVAYISWTINGHKIAAVPLVAKEDVDLSPINRAVDALKSNGPLYKSKWVWIGLVLLAIFAVFKVNMGKRKRAQKKR
ncbi:MAG: hypothetical protein ABI210_05820, partial [Abditibacteriaceae bacterium]